ncbi:MAG: protein-L-isoaspartate(D-aspartate) O-methyltransferase [Hylemonella sp.]|nr:protein-L-isoaspartate(D-aspartate) O-methyltransferase [Hylemonella sp.]MDH5708475.1 protein-L-isoaspartate(D-aspartate) O-methyltransferase [Hylemonella sp.]
MSSKPRPTFPVRLDRGGATPRPQLRSSPPVTPASAPAVPAPMRLPVQSWGLGADSGAMRKAMVSKLAAMGLQDERVLAAMGAIDRHRFIDSALINQAYEDTSLPIGWGQTISKPGVVARMIELLLQGRSGKPARVLEIGTGCGYQAAVLSLVATEVYSMERVRGLHEKARENMRPLRLPNVHLIFGDGMVGFPSGAPYAGIIAAAGGEAVPAAWIEQLAVGGRLVAPVVSAKGAKQALVVIDKTAQGVRQSVLEAVHFVPLKSGIA